MEHLTLEDEFDDFGSEHDRAPVALSPVKKAMSSPVKKAMGRMERFDVEFPPRACSPAVVTTSDLAQVPQEGPSQKPCSERIPASCSPSRRSQWQRSDATMEIVAKWRQERQLPAAQLIGVCRHAERADASWALVNGSWWHRTEEFAKWPIDPPLSDNGMQEAQTMGREVRQFAEQAGSQIHVIVTSPYWRCVQTAAEICRELGNTPKILLDRTLGEVYGPAVMGTVEPRQVTRPMSQAFSYFRERGVNCECKEIGKNPQWPEDLRKARWRFVTRVLTYMRRSVKTRRNFLVISHADCVGASLSIMPSEVGKFLEKVEYGGMFLAKRELDVSLDSTRMSSKTTLASSKTTSSFDEVDALVDTDESTDEKTFDRRRRKTCPPRLFAGETSGDEPLSPVVYESMGSCDSLSSYQTDDSLPFAPKGSLNSLASLSSNSFDFEELERTSGRNDGWQVQTYRILHNDEDAEQNPCVDKNIQALAQHSRISREVIELLLGQLSDLPLSSQDELMELPASTHGSPGMRISHTGTYSTFLFGASSSDLGSLSQVPSRAGTASFESTPTALVDHKSPSFFRMASPVSPTRSTDFIENCTTVKKNMEKKDDIACRLKSSAFSLIARRRLRMQSKDQSERPNGLPSISAAAHQAGSTISAI